MLKSIEVVADLRTIDWPKVVETTPTDSERVTEAVEVEAAEAVKPALLLVTAVTEVDAVMSAEGPATLAVVLTEATLVDCTAVIVPERDTVAAERLVAVDVAHAGGLGPAM